jgi:Na+/H+ antiporter NhaD/arsenite permease-like protein
MSSTLAGNLTILGSIANIIVIEGASTKVKISFWEYLKVGFPLTLLSILTGFFILKFFLEKFY